VAIADCVARFLEANGSSASRVQIVSLGAGFDTLFSRLMQQPHTANVRFVEIDCNEIVRAKTKIFEAKLDQLLPHGATPISTMGGDLAFQCEVGDKQSCYALGACDLGDVQRVASLLQSAGIDLTAPTLVLAECVVVRRGTVHSSLFLI
jgi:tRNA wybutosine-synthesizing protein 4